MSMDTLEEMVEWLKSCDGVKDIRPGTAEMYKKRFPAAFYRDTKREEDRDCLSLIGPMPIQLQYHKDVIAYNDQDWYITCYSPEGHPHYPWFLMLPWTLPEKIDHYDYNKRTGNKITRRRVPMVFTPQETHEPKTRPSASPT